MHHLKKHLRTLFVGFGGLTIVSGLAFYFGIVRNPDVASTNPLSIIFGWQWIYLFLASVIMLIFAIRKHDKRLLKGVIIIFITLFIVFVPAQFIFSNGLYITGDGGPAGPEFNCLVWNRGSTKSYTNIYNRDIGLCSLMSIPSFNKFLIDRNRDADQTDGSISYYAMLAINEALVVSGLIIARRKIFAPFSHKE